jgi:ribosome maturation protein Sdo1
MPRGNGPVTKVFFKGSTDDFIVFIESPEELAKWKQDKSIPLTDVVNSFKIMVTHKHGAQGEMDTASNASLENEFGTKNEDEVIIKILEQGQPQTVSVRNSILLGERFEAHADTVSYTAS